MRLSQTFTFDAAHTLQRNVPLEAYQASCRVHGHTYHAEVSVDGEVGSKGMLTVMEKLSQPGRKRALTIDLLVLQKAAARVREMLDHRLLDDVPGLGNPTLENLCIFIAANVDLPIASVSVWRADGGKCTLENKKP